ncbi:MAG: hypothetical protein HQK55_06300 [Deltaproteobacteria bacterium]|nr:hypothetical protein [Deltaproteobacteria bacterium]
MDDMEIWRRCFDQPEEDRKILAEILAKIISMVKPPVHPERWWVQLNKLIHQNTSAVTPPTKEQRLAAYQAVREAGVIPEEAAFFLIAYTIEWIAQDRIMADFQRRMENASQARSMQERDELAYTPPDWDNQQIINTFLNFGETAMAELYKNDRPEFERLKEVGRRFFFNNETWDIRE